jgi:ABC-type branched-subunit amino acid transport system substrate-binding protein
VKALRATGFTGTIAGTPCFGRASFAAEAGAAAEGGLFPWVGKPAGAFQERFAARFGTRPDYAAASAFDSVSLIVAAIRRSGLDHARIRRALAAMATYDGASGRIEWDRFGQNRRPPVLATISAGAPRLAGPAPILSSLQYQ